MKILIIKRDKIGDLLLTTPLFALIKKHMPAAELHLLANTYNGWVVENSPHIDRLWLYPRSREGGKGSFLAAVAQFRQILQLRREWFDWIIVAGSYASKRANWRARHIASRTTRIVAYCDDMTAKGITDPLLPPDSGHETTRMAALLKPLGIDVVTSDIPFPCFEPPVAWLSEARNFLEERGLAPGGYVMLGVGARRRTRQPDAEQILRWAQAMHQHFGLKSVFTWTPGKRDERLYPGDDEIADAVLSDCPDWIVPYRGTLSVVVGLTWHARTSIYPDSGLMHVAAASAGGVVGLFTSSPEQWGPRGKRARVLVANPSVGQLPDETVLAALESNLQTI